MVLFVEGLHIVGGVGPGPGVALAVCARHLVDVGSHGFAHQVLVEVLYVLQTEVCLEGEAVDGHHGQEHVAEDTPGVVLVIAAVVESLHGVGDIGCDEIHRACPVAVKAFDRECRVLAHRGEGDATVVAGAEASVRPVGYHEVFAYLEIFADIVGGVYAGRIAAVEGFTHHTVLVDIVGREHE